MARIRKSADGKHGALLWVRRYGALVIFALMTIGGPLAFGAVDLLSQIVLLGLFAIGLLLAPPAALSLGKRASWLLFGGIGLLIFKDFAPASWFGVTLWRKILTQSFGLNFLWTHHPEPGRAIDALCTATIGGLWFIWVRSICGHRRSRVAVAWTLFFAAAIVAAVSFATKAVPGQQAIYGLRYSPGWVGFGPFPNRNHTASFLVMGMCLGFGCVSWAGTRRRPGLLLAALGLLALELAAVFATRSRGGLLVMAVGLIIYLGLMIFKYRTRRVLGISLAAILLLVASGLVFGAEALSRFGSKQGGEVSDLTRIQIWRDTIGMCKDAPLLGHGAGSFTELFPLYQEAELNDQVVLHPESSWLQWLAEMGAVLVVTGAVAIGAQLYQQVKASMASRGSFFLRAGGFAAGTVLLIHSVFDVPAHRWGTAGFALAALALACAVHRDETQRITSRWCAAVPLAIAGFWVLPFWVDWPSSSPMTLQRLLVRETTTRRVPLSQMEKALQFFPLNPYLHQAIGLREIDLPGNAQQSWPAHFRVATRLLPGSWSIPLAQARACRRIAPGMALHYWQLAIERAGHRREEILQLAYSETASLPAAREVWLSYVESHPDLLLTFAMLTPKEIARGCYVKWWQSRALGSEPLTGAEVTGFYRLAGAYGEPSQLDLWMQRHPDWKRRDGKAWAVLMHQWKKDAAAWQTLSSFTVEPAFPPKRPLESLAQLEQRWRDDDKNILAARSLAHALELEGKMQESAQIILTVASRENAPAWFLEKAAFHLAAQGRLSDAVELLLRDPSLLNPEP